MVKYLDVYEPLINLIERGYLFEYADAGLMIYGSGLHPLNGWYERFVDAEPITASAASQ